MAKVLIIDDDLDICQFLTERLTGIDHSVAYALNIREGLAILRSQSFEVVFLDVQLPDGSGLDVLSNICEHPEAPEVIIMTGEGDPEGAQKAIQDGAWEYLQKPLDISKIIVTINRVLQYRSNLSKNTNIQEDFKFEGFIGKSLKVREIFGLLAQAAATDSNVLITGETGTGKELFANAVHANSSRAARDFVVVDCAALPENLVETILYGHEKGAFTGAERSRIGLVTEADRGTLFLDEIGELRLSTQKIFLRVLQEQRYRPVGGRSDKTSDFRLIAATNRDLEQMVAEGLFRADLFYRLKTFEIHLPPLRSYRDDLREMVVSQTNKFCLKNSIQPKGFSPDFFEVLSAYHWPGNIRELFHVLEVSIVNAINDPILFAKHVPQKVRSQVSKLAVVSKEAPSQKGWQNSPEPPAGLSDFRSYREAGVARLEREYCKELMKQTKGNIAKACNASGLGRSRLYSLLKKHEVSRNGWDH